MKTLKKQRVVVAMSGGVDSSVAALLMKRAGFEVIGITLKLWEGGQNRGPRGKGCCFFEDVQDARRVCEDLDIPFYSFNFEREFNSEVVEYFVREYARGRTPNPCIHCNDSLKFGRLFEEATKLGAHLLATGHHARIRMDADGTAHLLKGLDPRKDQSYVLYGLGQERLRRVLFPVGEYLKQDVRRLALEYHLPTAEKKESQDVCFIPGGDFGAFIRERYPVLQPSPGHFIDRQGKVLGEHEGIHSYTIGQRRGLGIGSGQRMYITRIDPERGEVTLGTREDLNSRGFIASQLRWIHPLDNAEDCQVKIRYQRDEIPCLIQTVGGDGSVKVSFKVPYPAVTPGQAAVFYRGDEVLGGGWIEKAL